MSELLHNPQARRAQLKEIILALHAGQDPDTLKQEFKALLDDVGANEIGHLEQELIGTGELSEQEVKRLCDLHAAVFHDALQQQGKVDVQPGHPLDTFQRENRALEKVFSELQGVFSQFLQVDGYKDGLWEKWRDLHNKLLEIEKHFSRKENILFPYLEKHGFLGPSKVMWALQDDIRAELKEITAFLSRERVQDGDVEKFVTEVAVPLLATLEGLIFKEENIMFPMCMQNFSAAEWWEIYQQSDEIGYTLVKPGEGWQPVGSDTGLIPEVKKPDGVFKLETGQLNLEQINLIFKHLPVDVTFVDKDDIVRYFSQGPERIFVRTPAVIGRKVQNCHPPESVHVVEKIVSDFKTGKRKKADFWLQFNGMYVYISYYAMRDGNGDYAGTLEVTQNIKPLQEVTGEKRILEDN